MDRAGSGKGLSRTRAVAWLPVTWWPPLALVALGLFLHWPGGAGLKADDYQVIRYASDWRNCLADFTAVQYGLHFFEFYRPLITLSLGIDHALFGAEPIGYLLENCLALLLAAVLLYLILGELWPRRSGRLLFALVPPLLWLCSPLPVLSVPWVVGRVDTHVAPPLLAALYFHLRYRRGGPAWPVWLFALVALATKETAIGFPLIALGLDLLDPKPTKRKTPQLFGRALTSLPYLLLLPAFFVFRRVVLGTWIGGYGFLRDRPLDPFALLEGFAQSLVTSLFPDLSGTLRAIGIDAPGFAGVLSWACTIALLLAVLLWVLDHRRRRVMALSAGLLLVTAGLFGPLAPLLPDQNPRYAYLACIWMLVAWTGMSCKLGRGHVPLTVFLGLLPALWLLPAQSRERERMASHDRFNQSLVDAMQVCTRLLPEGEPVVLGGDAERANNPYRFLWGLGSVLKPPFTAGSREVVTLRELHPSVVPAQPELVCAGLPCWVEVDERGGRVVEAQPGPRKRAEHVGTIAIAPGRVEPFSGTLTGELLLKLADPETSIGYRVGPGYDGTVAVCTSVGSLVIRPPLKGDVLQLREILGANATWKHPGAKLPVGDIVWNAADLAKDSPIYLIWREREAVRVGVLRFGPDFSRTYLDARW